MEETLIDKDIKRKKTLFPGWQESNRIIPDYAESIADLYDEPRHPSEKVSSQIRRFMQAEGFSHQSDQYLEKLVQTLTTYTGLSQDKIMPFTGINQALETIIKAFTSYGDEILICGPDHDTVADIAERYGVNPQYHYAPSPFASDTEGVIANSSEKTRLIYLSSPNPVTGTVYQLEDIKYILDWRSDSLLLLDESLYEYYQMSAVDLVNMYDNLVILRTFSAGFELSGTGCDYVLSSDKNLKILKPAFKGKYSATSLAAALFTLRALNFEQRRWASIREIVIYLSTRLRSFGVSCRITPGDFMLVYSNNTKKMYSFLNSKKITARNLKDVPQMEGYIALAVSDNIAASNIIECFRQMPRIYYSRNNVENPKLILKKRLMERREGSTRAVKEND